MKNKLLTLAGALALLAVLGKYYAVPAVAQAIRAALVKNVDEPGRLPYTSLAAGYTGNGCSANCIPDPNTFSPSTASFALLPPVPIGKRLIVNHVFGGILLGTLKSVGYASAPHTSDYDFDKLFFTGPFTQILETYYFDAQPFFTIEPGANVWVRPNRGTCNNCNGYVRVSGYLIDAVN